jgi:hypothetical protein
LVLGLLVALVAAGCSGSHGNVSVSGTTTSTLAGSSPVGDPSTATATTADPPSTTTTTIVKTPIGRTLSIGSRGNDVKMVQQRLKDMHFEPGPINGTFTLTMTQAVWAFQHLMGVPGTKADGKVTPALWSQMQDPLVLNPQKDGANHLEIYLPMQVAVLYTNGQPSLITHISSGNGRDWCSNGVCGKAITPGGVYSFGRRISGWHQSDLGEMYNPVYFNYGIAVHGELSVPNYPASHGCIRIPMAVSQYFPSLVHTGDAVYVFDGVKDPSAYGPQPPPWNTKDPNATTTTVKPTTTMKPPTTTTKPPTTTTKPPTTTTTKPPTTTTKPPTTTTGHTTSTKASG